MDKKKILGQKIRNFRLRANKSQLDLELEIGMSTGSMSRIENGQVNPTKETLLRIILLLNLAPADSANLFNVDISSEINKVINFTTLLDLEDIDLLTDSIVKKINIIFNTDPISLWLWDSERASLVLRTLKIPNNVRIFAENIIGFKLEQLVISSSDPRFESNDYLRSIIEERIIENRDLYLLAKPFLSKEVCSMLQVWLKFHLAINLPLIFNGKKLGVLGVVWNGDYISTNEKTLLQSYADQIAIVIYHARVFIELKQKYTKLKIKYGEPN